MNNNKNRIIVASSRAPHIPAVSSSLKKNVFFVNYSYETSTLNDIIVKIHQTLKGAEVESIAFLLHSSETEMFVCFPESRVISIESVVSDESIKDFFKYIVQNYMNYTETNKRIDFLNACISNNNTTLISSQFEAFLNISVVISKDIYGSDTKLNNSVIGEFYFNMAALREKLSQHSYSVEQKLKGYEKIRTVGKGAFGTAVLYRKVADDTMVVIKEINMMELTATERQMALNEVQVLSLMNHLNIISYLGSFELDGVLMIEMEYADGGTLAQFLSRQEEKLDERDILEMFKQVASAIRHMHDNNILHRDLKTANVFLTKDNIIKVGDFGISKVMVNTRAQAQTVLGTPYYISPEMCEGKQYDQKSDIWALGCILYEMTCLQKTFEGTNLPALVNKIMKGHFQPIPVGYSSGLRQLIHDLLQRDPYFRPTAAEIVDIRVPRLVDYLLSGEYDSRVNPDASISTLHSSVSRTGKPERSVLYELTSFETSVSIVPIQLPPRCKIKNIVVSSTHFLALTTELLVYSWGEDTRGQLGHGEGVAWRQHPQCIELLRGKSVKMIAAGEGFSLFVSDSGMLMSCGDGTFGCLGHGDWNNAARPRLIERLLSVDVAAMSCGTHHVVVISGDGDMYAWGRGDGGRLGLGHEEDCCLPQMVSMPSGVIVRSVRCGGDSTVIITSGHQLLACGRNTNNKLGLSQTGGFFSFNKTFVEKSLRLSKIPGVSNVNDVSVGPTHTAILTNDGQVITMGRNSEGQLGRGHCKPASDVDVVKSINDLCVTMVDCGPSYTLVGTDDNVIYMWGTRHGSMREEANTSQSWPHLQVDPHASVVNVSTLNLNRATELILEPKSILALYSSPAQVAKGITISLSSIHAAPRCVYVLVNTTVPLVDKPPRREGITTLTEDSGGDVDELGPIPDWIQAEVAQSEANWKGFS